MSPGEIVAWLAKRDIRLSVKAGKLCVDAPSGVMTDELRQKIAGRKEELLSFLWPTKPPPSDPDHEEKGRICPVLGRSCRAAAVYPEEEGIYCAHRAVFDHRPGRPVRVNAESECPRRSVGVVG